MGDRTSACSRGRGRRGSAITADQPQRHGLHGDLAARTDGAVVRSGHAGREDSWSWKERSRCCTGSAACASAGRSATTSTTRSPPSAAPSAAGDDRAPHFVGRRAGDAPQGMACSTRQNALTAVVPTQPHIRDLSTSTSQPGANASKPCSISQRTTSRLRNDHHARITSRSTAVP